MKKNIKTITGLIIAFIIGISTTVGAATVFNSKDITYSSDKTTKTNVKDSLDELYIKAQDVGECPSGMYCYTTFCPTGYTETDDPNGYKICKSERYVWSLEIGSYISFTPPNKNFVISKEKTGYSNDQTINLSELNLWKVYNKHGDGTIEMESAYASSSKVCLQGKNGYMNLAGVLNDISKQVINNSLIKNAYHLMYNGQIEYCTSESDCPEDGLWAENGGSVNAQTRYSPSGTAVEVWTPSRVKFGGGVLAYYYINLNNGVGGQKFSVGNNCLSVLPVIRLSMQGTIKSGDGSKTNPYKVNGLS